MTNYLRPPTADDLPRCRECQLNPEHSRGLCRTCYSRNRRNGTLDDWPNKEYFENPLEVIRWGFRYHPELVAKVATEHKQQIIYDADYQEWAEANGIGKRA